MQEMDALEGVAAAIFGKPRFAGGVVGERALKASPKAGAMVRLKEMDELVGDDVLDDARREQDGAPVKIQRIRVAT